MERGNNLLCAWFDGKLSDGVTDAEVVDLRFAAVMVFIIEAWLSHTAGDRSGEESRWLAQATGIREGVLRMAAHVFLFLMFSLFAGSGWGWPGIAGTAAWSVLDEVTKVWVRGRHCSIVDIGLNLIGVVVGAGVWVMMG